MADTKAAGTNGSAAPMALREGMKRMGSVSNAPWWSIEKGAKLFGHFRPVGPARDSNFRWHFEVD